MPNPWEEFSDTSTDTKPPWEDFSAPKGPWDEFQKPATVPEESGPFASARKWWRENVEPSTPIATPEINAMAAEEFSSNVKAAKKAQDEPIIPSSLIKKAIELDPMANIYKRLPLPESVKQFGEGTKESVASGLSGMTTGEGIATLPAFAIPVVGEGLAAFLGGKSIGAGARKMYEADTPQEAGAGFGEAAMGASMVIPAGLHAAKGAPIPAEVRSVIDAAKESGLSKAADAVEQSVSKAPEPTKAVEPVEAVPTTDQQGGERALPKQIPDEGVLRAEEPQVGLPQVGEGESSVQEPAPVREAQKEVVKPKLVPVILDADGKTILAAGTTHSKALASEMAKATTDEGFAAYEKAKAAHDNEQRGFVNADTGEVLDRVQAGEAMGQPVGTALKSEDLPITERTKNLEQWKAKNAPPVKENLTTAPATPEGSVRLYHGDESASGGGVHWTTDPNYAASQGKQVSYVDLPKSEADAANQRARDTGNGTPSNHILTPEQTKSAKPAEWVKPAEATALGSQQSAPPIKSIDEIPEGFEKQSAIDSLISKLEGARVKGAGVQASIFPGLDAGTARALWNT